MLTKELLVSLRAALTVVGYMAMGAAVIVLCGFCYITYWLFT